MLNESLVFIFSLISFIICFSIPYIWCSSIEATKFAVIYIVSTAGIFVYLNSLLITHLVIDSAGVTLDGFVPVYDDIFISGIKEGLFSVVITYLFGAVLGSYFGAKKKFKS
ncbi:hypothetical protein CWM83_17910 [Klebsiella pneumoniae]|nr:hypothetical protein CWM83_17910 [Klebsiella pneumoniae]